MTNTYTNHAVTLTEVFGEPIYAYTVADAIRDEQMIQFSPATALEAGYAIPVVLTNAAYADAIEWTRPDGAGWQTADARFWDVLSVARPAAKAALNEPGGKFRTRVLRVPNKAPSGAWSRASDPSFSQWINVSIEGFDHSGAPCLVLSLQGED